MIALCDALLAAAANARSWLAGPGDPAPAKQRHGWLRQCHRISHMNEVERMSSIPTPSFPRKREPSAFGVGFRRTGSASHWVDQLTLLKCASAFAGMTVLKLLGMLLVLASAPAFAQQVIGEPRLLDGFEDSTSWRVVTRSEYRRVGKACVSTFSSRWSS